MHGKRYKNTGLDTWADFWDNTVFSVGFAAWEHFAMELHGSC